MVREWVRAGITAGLVGSGATVTGQPGAPLDLAATLERAGDRVQEYFARAQTLVCLETVRVQPLDSGMTPAGLGRNVESEMRLDWDPSNGSDGPVEARTMRQVLRVNGHPPRAKDANNCTAPEQHETETQPLSMLLPGQRGEYTFSLAGPGRVDRRPAIMLDFRERAKPTVEVMEVAGNDECLSFNVSGGLRGRIWLDASTYDVLRLDQGLSGLIEMPLPKKVVRRNGGVASWTLERLDSSMRFKPVIFEDPSETLLLPVSMSSLQVIRGGGAGRRRTSTEYKQYRRFLTGGRIVKEPGAMN